MLIGDIGGNREHLRPSRQQLCGGERERRLLDICQNQASLFAGASLCNGETDSACCARDYGCFVCEVIQFEILCQGLGPRTKDQGPRVWDANSPVNRLLVR